MSLDRCVRNAGFRHLNSLSNMQINTVDLWINPFIFVQWNNWIFTSRCWTAMIQALVLVRPNESPCDAMLSLCRFVATSSMKHQHKLPLCRLFKMSYSVRIQSNHQISFRLTTSLCAWIQQISTKSLCAIRPKLSECRSVLLQKQLCWNGYVHPSPMLPRALLIGSRWIYFHSRRQSSLW